MPDLPDDVVHLRPGRGGQALDGDRRLDLDGSARLRRAERAVAGTTYRSETYPNHRKAR